MTLTPGDVTKLLAAHQSGDRAALDSLMSLLYDDLRRIARMQMRSEQAGHTLQPTAVVNELYVRLAQMDPKLLGCRAQFFALAATTMRHILVDHARTKGAIRRGGRQTQVPLDENMLVTSETALDVLLVDEVLRDIETVDRDSARIAELRIFGGMSHQEIADVLDMVHKTVFRRWKQTKRRLCERHAADLAASK